MDRHFLRRTKIPVTVIILNFILFPFTGFYLVYRRATKSYDYIGNIRAMKFCGWLLISLVIIPTVLGIHDFFDNIRIFGSLWGLPGLYVLLRARGIAKYAEKYERDNSVDDYGDSVDYINDTINITPETPPKYKVVACTGCGAKKKILVGSPVSCDFCDTPLE